MNLHITGAGAGTGKTYRVCEIIADHLTAGTCRPSGLIATTFTVKAAAELRERIQARLLEKDLDELASRSDEALIGTVHSVCSSLLTRFAFEAGISPRVRVLEEDIETLLLQQAIEEAVQEEIGRIDTIGRRLGQMNQQTREPMWRGQIRSIIAAARSNGVAESALPDMGKKSARELCAYLPTPTPDNLETLLATAIQAALEAIPLNEDKTGTTAGCVTVLRNALADLNNGTLAWPTWYSLAKLAPGAKSRKDVEEVTRIAGRVEEHPGLRRDIESYLEGLFNLAAKALNHFNEKKRARGMLDYTDLEVLTLGLLEKPSVQTVISEEFDLLVVDEFQDTSPIQLALFVKLAGLVMETHWVGDTKQAIYGFRGCDPELMRLAEHRFRGDGKKPDILSTSRRHSPGLTDFFNSLFPDLFARTHEMKAEETRLTAFRSGAPHLPPSVEVWKLNSHRTKKDGNPSAITEAEQLAAVATGIQHLKSSGIKISDKRSCQSGEEKPRPLQWRDIAVLCRTNQRATELGAELAKRGIPIARTTPGLLSTPEAVLTMACIRWLQDPSDSVAAAEIISLEQCREIEEWLPNRIEWIQQGHAGTWGIDGELKSRTLELLHPLRSQCRLQTPAELIDQIMITADLPRIVGIWGPNPDRSAQRRANLEAMRGLARKYEANCTSASETCSLAGFLIWCDTLLANGGGNTVLDSDSDAVQVMTWHGAKGLEWPVVICHQLTSEPKPRLWNEPRVEAPNEFNPEEPLSNRVIRLWPTPCGSQSKGVSLISLAEASPAGQSTAFTAEREAARLLYVGLTRARDLLILPRADGKQPWLPQGIQLAEYAKSFEELDEVVGDNPKRMLREFSSDPVVASKESGESVESFRREEIKPREFIPANLLPSACPAIPSATVAEVIDYAPAVDLGGTNLNPEALGNAVHRLIARNLSTNADELTEDRAQRIFEAYNLSPDKSPGGS